MTPKHVNSTIRRTSDLTDADYERAIGVMVRHKYVSTSLVQRELGLGYNAADKLVERAEADGIVTRPNEVGKRSLAAIQPDPEPQPGYVSPSYGISVTLSKTKAVAVCSVCDIAGCHHLRDAAPSSAPASVDDHEPMRIGTIGNYYGALNLKREGGQDYWAIEDWDDSCRWVEIPAQLADALRALGGERG